MRLRDFDRRPRVEVTNTGPAVGLPAMLLVLFVGLKLTGHITWSWVWVLAPVWGPISLLLVVLAAVGALSWAVTK